MDIPEGFSIQRVQGTLTASKMDGKHWPVAPRMENGFELLFSPSEVAAGRAKPMATFTREFRHPEDRMASASHEAQQRFQQDGRRFLPHAYEQDALLWKEQEW